MGQQIKGALKYTLASLTITVAMLNAVGEAYAAEKISVKIVDRQNSETSYTYFAPARANADSNSTTNCSGNAAYVNCSGSTRASVSETAAHTISYVVQGATLALKLPDGRIAVVNCQSKYKLRGDYINRRSCRLPLVDDIKAEFNGKKAKIEWSTSLDGKKNESEPTTSSPFLLRLRLRSAQNRRSGAAPQEIPTSLMSTGRNPKARLT